MTSCVAMGDSATGASAPDNSTTTGTSGVACGTSGTLAGDTVADVIDAPRSALNEQWSVLSAGNCRPGAGRMDAHGRTPQVVPVLPRGGPQLIAASHPEAS